MEATNDTRQGEFRHLKPREIALMVVTFRRLADMKQMTLAFEAGVSERTIQRIEQGEKVDDETLRRVTRALKLPEDAFVAPLYIPTTEEAFATTKSTLQKYQTVEIRAFAVAKDFDAVLGSHGWLIDDRECGDTAAREIADLRDLLEDWNGVYHDISHAERLGVCEDLLARVRDIECKGLVTRFGVYSTADDFTVTVIIFIKKHSGRQSELKQAVVPRHFGPMLVG